MQRNNVCFVSYLDQDNLGVGYLASSLLQYEHFEITIIDIKESFPVLIKAIADTKPIIVGFSIVFQTQLDVFQKLATGLRQNGIKCHFTAGGHYPSLRYEELMHLIPELDSIVLFEGEHTIVELAESIRNKKDWSYITGIAYRTDGTIKQNELRPLENDLDSFPLPIRRPTRPEIMGQKVINLVAGRGCYYRCSFCSIHRFYSHASGGSKRIRRPEFVAREMQLHFEEEGCTIFLFQDDDFPLLAGKGLSWTEEFCNQLVKKNLADNVMWKISCRVNEVDEKVFSGLMEYGLGMVYLGIESGNNEALQNMNKRITTGESLAAAGILKKLKLPYEFGFMMLDPFSTFESLQENVEFLRQLCGDGSASVGLTKMLALAGTDIQDTLRSQGRLYGRPPFEDYSFLDTRLDDSYIMLSDIFDKWMHTETGFMNFSRFVHLKIEAFSHFYNHKDEAENAVLTLHQIVSAANHYLLDTVISVADLARSTYDIDYEYAELKTLTGRKHEEFCDRLADLSSYADKLAGI